MNAQGDQGGIQNPLVQASATGEGNPMSSSSSSVPGVPNGFISQQGLAAPVTKILPRQYSQCEFPDLVAIISIFLIKYGRRETNKFR